MAIKREGRQHRKGFRKLERESLCKKKRDCFPEFLSFESFSCTSGTLFLHIRKLELVHIYFNLLLKPPIVDFVSHLLEISCVNQLLSSLFTC